MPTSMAKDVANAPRAMATAHNATAPARSRTRFTRSARIPAGKVASAPTPVATEARAPNSTLDKPKAWRSWVALTPMVAMSASLSPYTAAKTST